jgi:biotin operon repressor
VIEYGYVKDHRSVLEWEWYKDANTSRLFRHLILTVNYEDKKWEGETVLRGQRYTSYQQLSFELGISIQCIRTAIKHLKSTGEITYVGTREYSIITVNNYDKFQSSANESSDLQQTADKPPTDHQQLCNKAKESNKKVKEESGAPAQMSEDELEALRARLRK